MDGTNTSKILTLLVDPVVKAVKEAISSFAKKWEAQSKLVWRIGEVAYQIGLSESTIRNLMDEEGRWFDPEFPKPIRLGNGSGARSAIGWRRKDVEAWVDSRPVHQVNAN